MNRKSQAWVQNKDTSQILLQTAQCLHTMRCCECRVRNASAPPDVGRDSNGLAIEDSAARHLSQWFAVQWQCEIDLAWRYWVDYTPQQNRSIENAYEAMATEIELEGDEEQEHQGHWVIRFAPMLQENLKTGTFRRVRRILVTHR